eukprot:TRINITY_DN5869_c0_g1_i2.p1 TRINITY_DN5869_c0_g1~~TRINITY_DN5869_c0_g1_i2.p1  ORF type:complete len:320 (+),score=83.96 TRINITY_DN5869_c0_g1_i2:742-1701(+)
MQTNVLIPPFRFAQVEENGGVYRGGYPTLKNFKFLKRLGLVCVVSLIPEKHTADLKHFAEEQKIELVHFKVSKYNEDRGTIGPDVIASVLNVLVNPDKHPIYVHDLDGANVTGLVIMCLRKLQNWNRAAILNEFSRFVPDGVVTRDEQQALDKFEGQIELPSGALPKWLWKGQKYLKHPSIQIKVPDSPRDAGSSPMQVPLNPLPNSGGIASMTPSFSLNNESKLEKTQKYKQSKPGAGKSKNKLPDLKGEIEFARSFTWNYKTEQRFWCEYFDVLFQLEGEIGQEKSSDDVKSPQSRPFSKIVSHRKSCIFLSLFFSI